MNNDISIGGYTEGELKFASFWVRHGFALRNALRWFVITINICTWGYVAWTLVDVFALSYPRESRLTQDMIRNQLAVDGLGTDAPAQIKSEQVRVFAGTDGRLNLAVDIHNQNEQWWVEFSYLFNVAGEQTPRHTGFIMPGESTILTELGFRPGSQGARVAELVVDDVRWHRVDPSVVNGRYADYQNDHFGVTFENIKFDRLTVNDGQVGQTSFDLVNHGAYGFWNLDLAVQVLRGGAVLAVNKITFTNIVPGETRHVELPWFESLPPVTETRITPIVNFLDPNSYLPTDRF
ncbi:MAG: hypothetical protein NUV81_01440 [bacterium]|nr:hypothetical protein [bacterium]